jgi:hypothetical protein
MAVGDSTLSQIVRREFQGDAISGENADPVTAEFPGEVRQNGPLLVKLNAEQSAGELFYYSSSDFDAVFFAHWPPVV